MRKIWSHMIHNMQDSRRVDPDMPDSDRHVIDGGMWHMVHP